MIIGEPSDKTFHNKTDREKVVKNNTNLIRRSQEGAIAVRNRKQRNFQNFKYDVGLKLFLLHKISQMFVILCLRSA